MNHLMNEFSKTGDLPPYITDEEEEQSDIQMSN
jgi:hypothetical protein